MKKFLTMAAVALMLVVASCTNRQAAAEATTDVDSTEVVVNDTITPDTLNVVDAPVDTTAVAE